MISIRKCPKDTQIRIESVEIDGDTMYFALSDQLEATVRLDHETVATNLGYKKKETRVEYADGGGEDYVTEFILDGQQFTREDYLDNMEAVGTELLAVHVFEKYGTILL